MRQAVSAGRVQVDGEVAREPRALVDETCSVAMDGIAVTPRDPEVVAVYHKPAGLLTTMTDPYGRACVGDVVPQAWLGMCGPIGRLDKDTTGALIFTDDGALHTVVTGSVPKTYRLFARGPVSPQQLSALRAGVSIVRARGPESARGPFVTAPAVAEPWEDGVLLTIHEGRNRQVRRMAKAVGIDLVHLHRDAVGPVVCPEEVGAIRPLTPEEVSVLRAMGPAASAAAHATRLRTRRARGALSPRELLLVDAWLEAAASQL